MNENSESMTASKLDEYMGREDLTIEELVEVANALLADLAPKQSRYRVTERADTRTLRYYVSQKLLPRPLSYAGGRARYSGSHLVRFLFIKRLQAEHHTLRRIARVLESKTDDELLVALGLAPSRRQRAGGPRLRRVSPDRLASATTPSPASGSAEQVMRRFTLECGASLDAPIRLMTDDRRRGELARELETLARELRASVDAATERAEPVEKENNVEEGS